MIIINQNYGQLCNRLFLYAHLLAYSIEEGCRLWYPGFSENIPYFPNLRNSTGEKTIFGTNYAQSVNKAADIFFRRFFYAESKPVRWSESILKTKIHCKMEPLEGVFFPDRTALKLPKKLCFFQGWAFRVHETWQKHHMRLRTLFQFDQSLSDYARVYVENHAGNLPIGIHIRLGDYQDVCQQWVYPKNFWLNVMKKLRENSGGRAVFIVVSDDPQIEFDEEWILRHRGNRFEDLAVLAGCKFIAGPPSTFNRWAAFVGGKPHYCVNRTDFMPSIEDFMQFKLSSNNPLNLNIKEINAIRWHGIA